MFYSLSLKKESLFDVICFGITVRTCEKKMLGTLNMKTQDVDWCEHGGGKVFLK